MFEWHVPLGNHNSRALRWLAEELTKVSEDIEGDGFSSYREVSEGDSVIETGKGLLVAPRPIQLLELLLARHESGLLAPQEWIDPVQTTKSVILRSLISLELAMIPELQPYRRSDRQISFRKGGVIVWREKPKED